MRFAPVALVLVVGAGVVLWFGNTLNSWVVGGLIGGLAALLISIPISLTLFFHLSHRHEERLRAQEELALAQAQEYQEYEEEVVEVYEADDYMLPEEQEWYEEGHRASTGRYLPVPARPRLPAPVQSPRRQGTGQPGSGKIPSARQLMPDEQVYYPGFPGYQERSFRSKHQTAALRAAIDEAAQQDGRTGRTSAHLTRKSPSARPTTPFEQADRTGEMRSSRNLTRQNPNQQYRQHRTVDGTFVPPTSGTAPRRSLPAAGESSAGRSAQRNASRHYEPETEQLRGRYQQTGPIDERQYQQQQTGQLRRQQTGSMRQQQQTGQLRQQHTGYTGQTGQLARNPRLEEQRRNSDVVTGSLRNSMTRRAPYMYDDDPIRDEFAQMVDPPSVRRSSRREVQQYSEEEE